MSFNTSIEAGAVLTVEELDASPSVEGVNKIIFSNSTVTDNGDDSVTVDTTVTPDPGGSDTEIQWNNSGVMDGTAQVNWDSTGDGTLKFDELTKIHFGDDTNYAEFYHSDPESAMMIDLVGPNTTTLVTNKSFEALAFRMPNNDQTFLFGSASYGRIEYDGALDAILIQNQGEDRDIVFRVDDGGVDKSITLDGSEFQLVSSTGTFDFADDHLTTTGDVTATTFYNQNVVSFADADLTPSISESNVFLTANTGATTITDFDDSVDGQTIRIVFGDGNTTLEHGSNIKLTNGGNWTFSTDDAVTLISSGGVWYEVGRAGGGSGSITGPGSSTDNAIVRWNGAGGNALQNSGIIIDDSDNITGVGTLSVSDDAFSASWNGSVEVPTKNALYDKINALETGLDWQDSIIDIQEDATLDPGASPATGDRYILNDVAALHANFGTPAGAGDGDIVQYDGTNFIVVYDVSVDTEGGSVWDEDSNNYYVYNGTAWVKWNTTLYTASDGVQLTSNDISLDVSGLAEFTGINFATDYFAYYDDSASDHKKIKWGDIQSASRSSFNDGDILFIDSAQDSGENAVAGWAFDNATNRLFLSRQDATAGIISGQFNIEYNTASYKGIAIKQNGTQTHDFLYGESSGGSELFSVSALGGAYFGDSINVLGTVQGDEIQWDNGTSGSVLFLNGSKQIDEDNSNFFWDNTNKRLGIGEGTPTAFLHIAGASSGGGGTAHILLDKTDDSYSNLFTSQPFVNSDTLVFMTQAGANGGFDWSGFSNSGGESGVYISGHTGASPTVPSIRLRGWKHDGGTDRTAVTGTEKIVGFLAGDTEVAYIDATGNIQSDAYTEGSVLFAGASGVISQDNSNFYWDDSANKLGVGTTSTTLGKVEIYTNADTMDAAGHDHACPIWAHADYAQGQIVLDGQAAGSDLAYALQETSDVDNSGQIWLGMFKNGAYGPSGTSGIVSAKNGTGTTRDLILLSNDNALSTPQVTVKANTAFVGINQTNPAYALDIVGDINEGTGETFYWDSATSTMVIRDGSGSGYDNELTMDIFNSDADALGATNNSGVVIAASNESTGDAFIKTAGSGGGDSGILIESSNGVGWAIGQDNSDGDKLKINNATNSLTSAVAVVFDGVTSATFTGDVIVPDEAYGAGWNGSLEVPTKNAVYDKIESISGGGDVTGPGSSTDNAIARFDGTTGKIIQNSGITIDDTDSIAGATLDDFDNYIHADGVHTKVINNSGAQLDKGTPVYISGYDAIAELSEISKADADDDAKMPCIGLVAANIANGSTGAVTSFGDINSIDTSSWSVGDSVYVNTTAGTLTNTRPTGATTNVQKIAMVKKSHLTNGTLLIMGAYRSNDVSNKISDSVFRIHDDGDSTKLVDFQLSGLTTATTRTLTVPDASGTIVLNDNTATLTNKSGNISQWTNDSGYITATLTQEQVEDYAGGLVANATGTHTGITITYQDATGDMDFVVADTTVAGDTGSTGMTPGDTLTIAGGTEITTAMSGDTLTINADFTPSSTDTVTNKTIDGDSNTISNLDIGNEVDWAVITDVADRSAFASGDKLLIFEAGVGLRKIDYDDLPAGGGGETNTASNVGTGGVGVFKQKTGVDLEFKKINAGSSKVTITDDVANNEVDVDIVEANIDHDSLSGFVAGEHFLQSAITTVGTVTTGNVDAVVSAASTTTAGKIEIGTTAEIDSITASRAMAPDQYAASDFGKKVLTVMLNIAEGTDFAVEDGAGHYLHVPALYDGWTIVDVEFGCMTAGTTGTMTLQIHNVTDAVDVLSTKMTVASGAKIDNSTHVINASNDTVNTGDHLRVDVDTIHTTAAKGLAQVNITIEKQ